MKPRRLKAITLQEAIGKMRLEYCKNKKFNSTIIISYFGGTNNIFAVCTIHVIFDK